MKTSPLLLIGTVLFLSLGSAPGQISVLPGVDLTDPKLRVIDFEDLPVQGSSCPTDERAEPIDNPLRVAGIEIRDSHCLRSGFCSSPTCQPDPGTERNGNIVLELHPGSTIEIQRRSRLVVLSIQGIGDDLFEVRVTDGAGNTADVASAGVLFGTVNLGLSSPSGIKQIEVLPSSEGNGSIVLAALFLQNGRIR
jgi:hypothetical protein